MAYYQTADPTRQFLGMFEALSDEQDRPLRMSWDHASVEVARRDDGRIVHVSRLPFHIAPEAQRSAMEFSFRYSDGRPSFPVHISHPGDLPPVWIKAT